MASRSRLSDWSDMASSRFSASLGRERGGQPAPAGRAPAMAGLIRWVRPPRPWRPSKLRFEVEAQRSPGASLSGFIARHIEQPGSRQSKPAATNTLSSPSAFARGFTPRGTGPLRLPRVRTGHHERAYARLHRSALRNVRGGAQILDARVRARTDEHGVDC